MSRAVPGAGAVEVALRGGQGTTATHVRVADFDGPLALLLALIEAREMDVLTVPLGDLVEAYLQAAAGVEGERLGSLSGFVAVAAQLILIKSRAMLPAPPEDGRAAFPEEIPDPEAELRLRLIAYRAFRDAGGLLGERLERAGGGSFHREPWVALASARSAADQAAAAGPLPPEERLDSALLTDALRALAAVAAPQPPPETLGRTVAIEERARAIRDALRSAPLVVLQDLLRGVRDRVVAAVTFLAMLELVKQREIAVEQAEPWGPIVCRRLG
jgi:segregation and condensation protein A